MTSWTAPSSRLSRPTRRIITVEFTTSPPLPRNCCEGGHLLAGCTQTREVWADGRAGPTLWWVTTADNPPVVLSKQYQTSERRRGWGDHQRPGQRPRRPRARCSPWQPSRGDAARAEPRPTNVPPPPFHRRLRREQAPPASSPGSSAPYEYFPTPRPRDPSLRRATTSRHGAPSPLDEATRSCGSPHQPPCSSPTTNTTALLRHPLAAGGFPEKRR